MKRNLLTINYVVIVRLLLLMFEQLDISIIHGDGTNTVVKKGEQVSVTQDTNTRKVTKS